MEKPDWHGFLTQWSRILLDDHEIAEDVLGLLPPSALSSGWLGYPGATEAQIARAEARLGTKLPPSYRSFLTESNGWSRLTYHIYNLWTTDDIEWFSVKNQETIDIWMELRESVADELYFVYGEEQYEGSLRPEYLKNALEISDWGDDAICLLNPEIVTVDGEWEAWFFAPWIPGARRYRSFWDMVQGECAPFLKQRAGKNS